MSIRERFVVLGTLLFCAGCGNMRDQPRVDALSASAFFADGRSSRTLVEGTVPRGGLTEDDAFHKGREGRALVDEIPVQLTDNILARGQERFQIFCAPCHGDTGDGQGMIVQRGFPPPPTFHDDRLRNAPAGHFFDVVTNGYGKMLPFARQIPVEDRWAIIGYIRALQLSQNFPVEDLDPNLRTGLEQSP